MLCELQRWEELIEAASVERNPERLIVLISELLRVLDERANAGVQLLRE